MRGGDDSEDGRQTVIYCIVPRDLAPKLHEPLRRHFRDDPQVQVVVERRSGERRRPRDRRAAEGEARAGERRRVRGKDGRRVAERRASLATVEPPPLPRRAQRHAARLAFMERIEPTTEQAEDADTARLVGRIQAGDREAYADLYMRYFDRVYSYLMVVFNDPYEAEDATQQVFTQVLEALPRYERRRRPFRGWLFVVVRNQAVSRLREQGRLDVLDPDEINRRREEAGLESMPLGPLGWIADRELLLFVERLPLPQRQVLLLRYMLGLRAKEIAKVLDRTQTDVTVLQSRALRFLRERLAALGRGAERRDRTPMSRGVRKARVLRRRRYALLS